MTVNAQRSLRLIPKTDFSRLTGNKGELFYDPVNNTLRIFNSQLVGGEIIATRTWVNSTIAAGVINYNNLTNKPVLFSGSYNDLTNKPNIAGTYQFSVAADDSTQRVISTDEVIKFIGAGGITTASDAEGNITITGGGISSLVNSTKTVSLGSNGTLTVPAGGRISAASGYNLILGDGLLLGQGGSIFNENEDGLYLGGQNSDAGTYIQIPGRTASENGEPLIISHNWDADINIQGGGGTWAFGFDGALTIPGDIKSNGNINIEINLSDSTLRRWQFGEDGALTLPPGGTILNSSGQPYVNGVSSINTSVTTSIFTDASGDYTYGTLSYDYAVNGVSNSFSIEYSRPLVGGNVDINVGNTIVNGDLTLSGDIKSNGNINIDINLSDSTLRRWQFGEDGALTFPNGTNQITAWTGIPGPYADDEAATLAGVALGSPYHKTGTGGQVFVRLTSPS
jgi:hypothetical protein